MPDWEKEEFELVMMDVYPVLFTDGRLKRDGVPDGLYCYDVRHDDECQGIACEVSPFVMVNHWGTILSRREVPLTDGSYFPKEDFNYTGDSYTAAEYLQMDERQLAEAAGEPVQEGGGMQMT